MTTPDAVRSTVVDVDLDAIAANLSSIRDRAKADVIAVVKADAYGHGAEAVAETSFEAGAVMVAVATVEEGLALREAGVNGPILVFFGPTDSSEVGHAVAQDLVLTVWDHGPGSGPHGLGPRPGARYQRGRGGPPQDRACSLQGGYRPHAARRAGGGGRGTPA